ncbi:3' terminal RNA ribose 2'-O-methyltransferase Hen1|uniref:Small RNA 2'-O-methyltransferase n=1 Tax=Dendrosporobacter quercicolus TaxID=146817 RepID=A0A1G9M0H3_9FIRM|nr:3' terminal RNA ribose 2'-O-methyltransferase Hen1 [Dendrosporobacter quercicolus]NSL46862.1 3' terminal RNA ribose 2'-O-methyltransferase Hen1 [Dendrosporobacter quercicolus DSM 1736]SDL67225.1 3' terminal RNA ribose 2'-O-methyltransferase Hen1 [Dendrosporobacter quercicolus]
MLLTINYQGKNTQDLGYLLHKNPSRPQEFTLNYGKAYVFYPEVSNESTTAALLLDIDPIELARGKVGSSEGGLFDYVNDRPYVCSSFMSTALSRVFGTAMSGRSKEKQALADTPINLKAKIHMLAASNKNMLPAVFEPLGYTIAVETFPNDDQFPRWGQSNYVNLTLSGTLRLCELLHHLYVLIPVFDTQKHYYIADAEIEKLLSHGEGWLKEHPLCEYITSRYLHRRRSLINKALARLTDNPEEDAPGQAEPEAKRPKLNQTRLRAVVDEVLASGAKSVIDMGCGEGNLTRLLLREQQLSKVAAFDVAFTALERAKDKLKVDRLHETLQNKLGLFQGSLVYRDKRCEGFDCACVVEVIEHLDESRLTAFTRVLFEFANPRTVIITTPNAEYNIHYAGMKENALRHADHRFEWNRAQFAAWVNAICENYRYKVAIKEIGDNDDDTGTPTQMGVFTRCE